MYWNQPASARTDTVGTAAKSEELAAPIFAASAVAWDATRPALAVQAIAMAEAVVPMRVQQVATVAGVMPMRLTGIMAQTASFAIEHASESFLPPLNTEVRPDFFARGGFHECVCSAEW